MATRSTSKTIRPPHAAIVCVSRGRGKRCCSSLTTPSAADHGPYSEVGPVFVHAHGCPAYAQTGSLPQDFRDRELILRAYNYGHAIEDSIIAKPGRAEETARRFFENENIAYIHVRHTTYGCFDFSITRG